MKTNINDFKGIFEYDSSQENVRFLWVLSVPVCLGATIFVYAFFDQDKIFGQPSINVLYYIFAIKVVPVLGLITGTIKTFRKPGIKLKGIVSTGTGMECGILSILRPSTTPLYVWKKQNIGTFFSGEWTRKKSLENESTNVVVILGKGNDSKGNVFFDRIIISSKEKFLFQLTGTDCNGISRNDLYLLSGCSFELLGGNNGIPSCSLMRELQLVDDIISCMQPLNPPSCSLKISSDSARLGDISAVGMIGGLATIWVKHPIKKDFSGSTCDSDLESSLAMFRRDRGWN